MPRNIKLRITSSIISSIYDAVSSPYWLTYEQSNDKRPFAKDYYRTAVYRLTRKGLVRSYEKNGQKFLKLTNKGQLQALVEKAIMPSERHWDGKWRVIIFDVPEDARKKRAELRKLLRSIGYYKLQASVFISPHRLNREAINYLKQSGLIGYIRIFRADEVDDDRDLKKHFGFK